MRFPCVGHEVLLFWSEEKLNHKTDGEKLFTYFLTNKVFSKQILS